MFPQKKIKFTQPNKPPINHATLGARQGDFPAVIIQTPDGESVAITPKMARVLSMRLREFANIAEGLIEPDPDYKHIKTPAVAVM